MAAAKLLYIVVVDDNGSSFRYTRSLIHSTLQLMGCKPRHAFEVRPPPRLRGRSLRASDLSSLIRSSLPPFLL